MTMAFGYGTVWSQLQPGTNMVREYILQSMLYVMPTRPAGSKYCQKGLYTVHGKIYQAKNVTVDIQIVHDCKTLYEQEGMYGW